MQRKMYVKHTQVELILFISRWMVVGHSGGPVAKQVAGYRFPKMSLILAQEQHGSAVLPKNVRSGMYYLPKHSFELQSVRRE